MDLLEAQEVIQDMLDTGVKEVGRITARLNELKAEYEEDPWELTAKQIKLVEARLEKRTREVKALGVVASSF